MKIFKVIISVLILAGCKSSEKSFDSELSKLFFNANIKSEYDSLLVYFKKLTNLTELNSGWTVYPPLSALGQAENKIEQKNFEFHDYSGLSSELKNGTLNIRKVSPDKKALAALEITIEFNLKTDAEKFYKKIITSFYTLPITKEESAVEGTRSTIFHDYGSNAVFIISLIQDEQTDLYGVTLRVIAEE